MVMLLIAGAVVFGKFLAVTRIPFNIASWIGGFDLPPFAILTMIIIVYFLGGCFMDALAFVMLTIPIFFPGINVYVVYGVAESVIGGVPLESIFKGIVPFLLAVIVGLVIMIILPQIILVLPNLMY